jgi:probable F420-dependent oxidoreductase
MYHEAGDFKRAIEDWTEAIWLDPKYGYHRWRASAYSETGDFPAPFDTPWLDPLATLAFVAAVTERVRLGTTVQIMGYRPPVQSAKFWATLDQLSEGRAILGVGVGWMREEFEALGMPFDHRGARANEQLEAYDVLFREAAPSYEGRFYSFPEISFLPKPVHGHIPIWVGGHTASAFRRAARYGDGLHAAFTPVEELARHWAAVRSECEKIDRDPDELQLSTRVYLDPEGRMEPTKSLQGGAGQLAEAVAQWAEAGVAHLILDPVARGGSEGRLELIRWFVNDVRPLIP